MRKSILFIYLGVAWIFASGQNTTPEYTKLINKANALYTAKNYEQSALAFSEAFRIKGGLGTSSEHYNAACSYALANRPDSAFRHLNLVVTRMNYSDYGHIKGDPDFKSIHTDSRWNSIVEAVKQNREKTYAAIEFVKINGFKVETLTAGLEHNRPGNPVVVFENGMASGFGSWDSVAREISKTNTVFRYNRPRIGESENDSLPPTPGHIVQNLRQMLRQKGLMPPYLLVSHSFGGAFIRSYASDYPDEIAGLIFVDPVDFTQKKDYGDLPYLEIGLSQHQIDSLFGDNYEAFVQKLYEEMPGFYVEEVKISRALHASEFIECVRNPLPDVPVHFIQAGGYPEARNEVPTIYDQVKMFRISNNLKMKRWLELINPLKYGKYFYAAQSGHFIQKDDPDLVISSIKQALNDFKKIRK